MFLLWLSFLCTNPLLNGAYILQHENRQQPRLGWWLACSIDSTVNVFACVLVSWVNAFRTFEQDVFLLSDCKTGSNNTSLLKGLHYFEQLAGTKLLDMAIKAQFQLNTCESLSVSLRCQQGSVIGTPCLGRTVKAEETLSGASCESFPLLPEILGASLWTLGHMKNLNCRHRVRKTCNAGNRYY